MQKMNFPWQNGRPVSPAPWRRNDDAASAAPTREATPAPWTAPATRETTPAPATRETTPAPVLPEIPAPWTAPAIPETPAPRPIRKRVRQAAPVPRVIPGVVARLIPQERLEQQNVQQAKPVQREKREKPAKPVAQIHLFPLERDMQGCMVYRARLRRGGDPRVLSDLRLGDTIFTPEPRRIGFVGRAGYFSPGRKITSVVLGLL